MFINPNNIINILQTRFKFITDTSPINQTEKNLAKICISTIEEAVKKQADVEFFDELVFDDAADFSRKEGETESDEEFSDKDDDSDEEDECSSERSSPGRNN